MLIRNTKNVRLKIRWMIHAILNVNLHIMKAIFFISYYLFWF